MIWIAIQSTYWLFFIYSVVHIWVFKWGDSVERWFYTLAGGVMGALIVSGVLMTVVPLGIMSSPNTVETTRTPVVDIKVEKVTSGVSSWGTGQRVSWKTEDGVWHKGRLATAYSSSDDDADANVRMSLSDGATSSVVKQDWHSIHPDFWPFDNGEMSSAPDSYVLYVGTDLR